MLVRGPVKFAGLQENETVNEMPSELPLPPASEGEIAARLAAAAARALAEAAARRAEMRGKTACPPPERGGQLGPEPTRFGDWERKGLICDF